MTRPLLNRRLDGLGNSIFGVMSARAVATGSINLGQGFPDVDGPRSVAEAAAEAILAGQGNQYPPPTGIPELRQAVARHQRRFYGLGYDPDTEVLITAGATEAIAAALLALLEPGDEVIAFEPYYDSYVANIAMAGAVRVPLTLAPPDFRPDLGRLESLIGDRTRLLLLNSPHNPTGMVLTSAETEAIARIAIDRDLLVITDEAYEHLTFDREHIPLATIPGMRERTVSIGSAGKTFSFTGWKVGWATGTPELVAAVRTTKQFLTYVSSGPFQYAVAEALDLPDGYFTAMADDLKARRDLLAGGLAGDRLRGLPARRHLLHHHRHRPAGGEGRDGVLPGPPGPGGRGRHPQRRLLRRQPGGGPHHGPVRLLQAPRGAQGGDRPSVRPGRLGKSKRLKTKSIIERTVSPPPTAPFSLPVNAAETRVLGL